MRSAGRSAYLQKACFLMKTSLFHITFLMFVFDISPLFCAPSGCTHVSHTKIEQKFVKSCQIGHLCENVNVHFYTKNSAYRGDFRTKRKSISPTFTAKNLSNSATSGFQDCWCVAKVQHSPPKQSCFLYLMLHSAWVIQVKHWYDELGRVYIYYTRRDSD